jgi:hypothetical protein
MNKKLLLLATLLPACVTDPDLELAETESAITLAVTPVGTFDIRGDHIYYVGFDGSGYRAYELDDNYAILRKSPAVASSTAPTVTNLTPDKTSVLFSDGQRNVRLSLAGAATQTFDPIGVFGKSLHGAGGVTLRDGTLSRLINGNGFGVSTFAPVEAFSGPQPTAAPVLTDKERAYVAPAGYYLRHVDIGLQKSSLICKSPTPYASEAIATAPQPAGSLRVIAKLADGTVAECTQTSSGTTLRTIVLPFEVGDVALEGGGGVGFCDSQTLCDPNNPSGFWASSATTAELAYVFPTGKIVIFSLTNKYAITPIPIPRVVRSFSDGSALVLMSNGSLARVARP